MKKQKKILIIIFVGILVLIVVNSYIYRTFFSGNGMEEVSYNEFLEHLEDKNVDRVQVDSTVIYFTLKEDADKDTANTESIGISTESQGQNIHSGMGNILERFGQEQQKTYYTVRISDPELVDRLYDSGAVFSQVEQKDNTMLSLVLSFLISVVLPLALFFFLIRYMTKQMGKGGGLMSFGKSNARRYIKSVDGIRFQDVAGEDEAKEALMEIVNYLHFPQRYQEIGASMPKGALLIGPPGTGKTMLAKAVAGEAQVPFFSISGSEFVEMFVGMGAAKVRDLFKQASEKAPCIIFIDEIDTVGKKRDAQGFTGNDEREQTLNQLLTEMDGFDTSKGVVILGACNRPDSLDPALLRPGRFDRRITVDLPDYIGREAILRVHARKIKMDSSVNFAVIAKMSPGASGADLANVVNEAALRAVREGRQYVIQEDMEESIETVLAGYRKKNQILTEKEKMKVAYHETGHALTAALLDHRAPVTKITIIPRTSGALGYTLQTDEEERHLISAKEMEDKIAVIAGGRAAEHLIFGEITTGAANDIEQATKLAYAMVTKYGMSDAIGMVSMEHTENIYLGGESSLRCSQALAEEIDRQVICLVKKQQERAENILSENLKTLHRIAEYLYREETITGEVFMELMMGSDPLRKTTGFR